LALGITYSIIAAGSVSVAARKTYVVASGKKPRATNVSVIGVRTRPIVMSAGRIAKLEKAQKNKMKNRMSFFFFICESPKKSVMGRCTLPIITKNKSENGLHGTLDQPDAHPKTSHSDHHGNCNSHDLKEGVFQIRHPSGNRRLGISVQKTCGISPHAREEQGDQTKVLLHFKTPLSKVCLE